MYDLHILSCWCAWLQPVKSWLARLDCSAPVSVRANTPSAAPLLVCTMAVGCVDGTTWRGINVWCTAMQDNCCWPRARAMLSLNLGSLHDVEVRRRVCRRCPHAADVRICELNLIQVRKRRPMLSPGPPSEDQIEYQEDNSLSMFFYFLLIAGCLSFVIHETCGLCIRRPHTVLNAEKGDGTASQMSNSLTSEAHMSQSECVCHANDDPPPYATICVETANLNTD